jgi:hypothetical protein
MLMQREEGRATFIALITGLAFGMLAYIEKYDWVNDPSGLYTCLIPASVLSNAAIALMIARKEKKLTETRHIAMLALGAACFEVAQATQHLYIAFIALALAIRAVALVVLSLDFRPFHEGDKHHE